MSPTVAVTLALALALVALSCHGAALVVAWGMSAGLLGYALGRLEGEHGHG